MKQNIRNVNSFLSEMFIQTNKIKKNKKDDHFPSNSFAPKKCMHEWFMMYP